MMPWSHWMDNLAKVGLFKCVICLSFPTQLVIGFQFPWYIIHQVTHIMTLVRISEVPTNKAHHPPIPFTPGPCSPNFLLKHDGLKKRRQKSSAAIKNNLCPLQNKFCEDDRGQNVAHSQLPVNVTQRPFFIVHKVSYTNECQAHNQVASKYLCNWLMSNWTLYPIKRWWYFSFIFQCKSNVLSLTLCWQSGSTGVEVELRAHNSIAAASSRIWHINRCHVNTGCQTHSGQWSAVSQRTAVQLRIKYILLFRKEQVLLYPPPLNHQACRKEWN